jgi:hypothetical protein
MERTVDFANEYALSEHSIKRVLRRTKGVERIQGGRKQNVLHPIGEIVQIPAETLLLIRGSVVYGFDVARSNSRHVGCRKLGDQPCRRKKQI